jgi:large subunit ribosomal protein L20
MPRVKGGSVARKRRKKILKLAKGYFGSRRTLYKTAHEQVMKSLAYAYRDRKARKRDFRKLWITRINAACQLNGMKYSRFINGLALANVEVNRKMLADLAVHEPKAFTAYVKIAEKALANKQAKPVAPKVDLRKLINEHKTTPAVKETIVVVKPKPVKEAKPETKKEVVKPAPVKEVKPQPVKEVKPEPKKEVVKSAPAVMARVVKAEAPVKEEEIASAEVALEAILSTELKEIALYEDIKGARTMKKADAIKALARLGYKPNLGDIDLGKLLVTELRDMAAEAKIEGFHKLKKAELVTALKALKK